MPFCDAKNERNFKYRSLWTTTYTMLKSSVCLIQKRKKRLSTDEAISIFGNPNYFFEFSSEANFKILSLNKEKYDDVAFLSKFCGLEENKRFYLDLLHAIKPQREKQRTE